MNLSEVGKYYHTIKYLKARQIVARVVRRFKFRRPSQRPSPPVRSPSRALVPGVAPAPIQYGPVHFRLLNEEGVCRSREDWNDPAKSKLWLYNLHYFDDLNAEGSEHRVEWHRQLMRRWVHENPPTQGNGWEPYASSRRLVNWAKWCLRNEPDVILLNSMAVQARWLGANLEYHLLGNHLTANAKALIFCGLLFSGPEAEAWYRKGMSIFARELPEQVLSDGAHFELSPMYHASFMEDLLDIVAVHRAFDVPLEESWSRAVIGMREWLKTMSHPDGDISFFNDSAFGIAPCLSQLEAYLERLGVRCSSDSEEGSTLLKPSGYARFSNNRFTLICDCAAVGPDYLPGHSHADSLSYELSIDGRRVIVNSGTSEYGESPERLRQRGTAAHNTVSVDGENSSEVWAGFRTARRARTRIHVADVGRAFRIEASHDGYRRLAGRNVHTRAWSAGATNISVRDDVSGTCGIAVSNIHLHPEVTAEMVGGDKVALKWETGRALLGFRGADGIRIESSTWHPRFGVTEENTAIRVPFRNATLFMTIN